MWLRYDPDRVADLAECEDTVSAVTWTEVRDKGGVALPAIAVGTSEGLIVSVPLSPRASLVPSAEMATLKSAKKIVSIQCLDEGEQLWIPPSTNYGERVDTTTPPTGDTASREGQPLTPGSKPRAADPPTPTQATSTKLATPTQSTPATPTKLATPTKSTPTGSSASNPSHPKVRPPRPPLPDAVLKKSPPREQPTGSPGGAAKKTVFEHMVHTIESCPNLEALHTTGETLKVVAKDMSPDELASLREIYSTKSKSLREGHGTGNSTGVAMSSEVTEHRPRKPPHVASLVVITIGAIEVHDTVKASRKLRTLLDKDKGENPVVRAAVTMVDSQPVVVCLASSGDVNVSDLTSGAHCGAAVSFASRPDFRLLRTFAVGARGCALMCSGRNHAIQQWKISTSSHLPTAASAPDAGSAAASAESAVHHRDDVGPCTMFSPGRAIAEESKIGTSGWSIFKKEKPTTSRKARAELLNSKVPHLVVLRLYSFPHAVAVVRLIFATSPRSANVRPVKGFSTPWYKRL